MKNLAILPILTLLAACGVDGEPIQPALNTSIGIGPGGVHTSTSVSARKGPLSVGLSL